MVNLLTIRRVLAVDLGLDAEAVRECLTRLSPIRAEASDSTEIPLAEAVRLVALAEAMTSPASA